MNQYVISIMVVLLVLALASAPVNCAGNEDEAYQRGYSEGYNEGYDKGHRDGYEVRLSEQEVIREFAEQFRAIASDAANVQTAVSLILSSDVTASYDGESGTYEVTTGESLWRFNPTTGGISPLNNRAIELLAMLTR